MRIHYPTYAVRLARDVGSVSVSIITSVLMWGSIVFSNFDSMLRDGIPQIILVAALGILGQALWGVLEQSRTA